MIADNSPSESLVSLRVFFFSDLGVGRGMTVKQYLTLACLQQRNDFYEVMHMVNAVGDDVSFSIFALIWKRQVARRPRGEFT